MKGIIEIISKNNLADEPFNVIIKGLERNQIYKIEMEIHNYYCINAPMRLSPNTTWCSSDTFMSDELGIINLENAESKYQFSNSGAAMGLFFCAKPKSNKQGLLEKDLHSIPEYRSYIIQINCYKDENCVATAFQNFYYLTDNFLSRDIVESNFQGRLFYDKDRDKVKPAIIVVSGSDGRIEKAQNIAQLFACRGYTTLAVAYFGLNGLPENLNNIPVEILQKAHEYLSKLPFVDSNRIGIYGRSKGAELVLLSESYLNNSKAICLNSPSHVVYEGISGKMPSKTSSWTFRSEEVAYHRFSYSEFFAKYIFGKKLKFVEREVISLKSIYSPLLLIASKNDEVWDSYIAVLSIQNRYIGEFIKSKIYENTGHMLTIAYQPNHRYKNSWKKLLSESIDSWNETLEFFDKKLRNFKENNQ